ncbi:MAG: hypothetical protein ACOC44_14650 [Promethearchaeia archaeon]
MTKTKLLPKEIFEKRSELGLDNSVYLLVEIINKERDETLRKESVKYIGILSSKSDSIKE